MDGWNSIRWIPIVYKQTRLSNYVGNPFGFVDTQSYLNIMKTSRILRQIPKRFNSTATTRANSLPSHDHILHNSAAQGAAPLKNAITKTLFNKDSTTITFNTKGSENLVISFNNLFLRDSSRSARSVSYTHLDVYKRQLLVSWLCGDVLKISYLVFGAKNISVLFLFFALFQMSLDIYIGGQYIYYKFYYPSLRNESSEESIEMAEMRTNEADVRKEPGSVST